MLAIAITVVCVDVITAKNTVHWLQNYAGVVVCYYVCITVLRFVHFHIGVVPGELLAGFNRLEQQ